MTQLGITLRRIRFERQELLKDMAAKIHVSSAFLSAVETGKKRVPANFVEKINNAYRLSKAEQDELAQAAEQSVQEMKLDLSNTTPAQHQAALSFAKALNGLTDEDVSRIMRVFDQGKKKRGEHR